MSETERKSRGRNRPEAIFPRMNGLSPHNPKHRRTLAEAWTERAIVQEVLAQSLWHHSANLPCFIHLPRRGVDCDRQAQLWRAGDMAVEVEVENIKLAQLVREIGRRHNFNRLSLSDRRPVTRATMITRDFEEWGI